MLIISSLSGYFFLLCNMVKEKCNIVTNKKLFGHYWLAKKFGFMVLLLLTLYSYLIKVVSYINRKYYENQNSNS